MEKNKIYDNYLSLQKSNEFNSKTIKAEYSFRDKIFSRNFASFFMNKNLKVLELGCGHGDLAYSLNKRNFKNYVGIDISTDQINLCKKNFPSFKFVKKDILKFLKENKDEFDIVFMSHVFEHLNKKEVESFLKYLKKTLSAKGIFINVMPNASAYFNASANMYIDLTHEKLYTNESFNQLFKLNGFNNIFHKNYYIGRNSFEHLLHKLILKFFEFFIKLLGYDRKEIYTTSFISIVKNEK